MKLIIEIPLESNDLEERDFEILVKESKNATGINIMVGRPLNYAASGGAMRTFELTAENFRSRIEKV
jgi:hypothetical protein